MVELFHGSLFCHVFDIFEDKIKKVVDEFGAKVISDSEVYTMAADIYAPCALGATINDVTIPQLKCSVVAGAANNQLAEDRHRDILKQKGILYTLEREVKHLEDTRKTI